MNRIAQIAALLLAQVSLAAAATDLASLCADRTALERVYHEHRLGTKPSFEEAMPPELVAKLVRTDLKKETVLERVYGASITPAMVEGEVRRIDATTRAPEMLAKIKAALGNDPVRFAATFARPILVERTLRARFDNDDALHAPQRRETEQARAALLAGRTIDGMRETTWLLGPRPESDVAQPAAQTTPVKGTTRSASYSNEATVQVAQVLSSPGADEEHNLYFSDLDPELQNVLRAQLQKPGDISAVIEVPGGFLVFRAEERTEAALTASRLSFPKRSYEAWLAQQPE